MSDEWGGGREGGSGIVRGHLGLEPHRGRSNCTPVTGGVWSATREHRHHSDTLQHHNSQKVTLTFTGCLNYLHGSIATPKLVPWSDVNIVGGVGGQSLTGVLSHILSE